MCLLFAELDFKEITCLSKLWPLPVLVIIVPLNFNDIHTLEHRTVNLAGVSNTVFIQELDIKIVIMFNSYIILLR